MLQNSEFYYNRTNPPHFNQEQMYPLIKTLDEFFANFFFEDDENKLTRIQWAPHEYNYARRYETLNEQGLSSSVGGLQLPFLSYFRDDGWDYDDKPGTKQTSTQRRWYRWGEEGKGVEAQLLYAKRNLTGLIFFATERDASIAAENMLWWSNRELWLEYELGSNQGPVPVPLTVTLDKVNLLANKNMSDWTKEQTMSVVEFSVTIRTPLLKIPPDYDPIYITEEVVWYFHNQNFTVPLEELPDNEEDLQALTDVVFELHIDDVDIPPEPLNLNTLTNILFTTDADSLEASATFTWDYEGEDRPTALDFYVHLGNKIEKYSINIPDEPEPLPQEYTVEGLEGVSIYDVVIIAKWPSGTRSKYHYSIETPEIPERKQGLAGLKGLTF